MRGREARVRKDRDIREVDARMFGGWRGFVVLYDDTHKWISELAHLKKSLLFVFRLLENDVAQNACWVIS